jgi:hypothetical protein
MWIYCWRCVKQLGKFKMNLVFIIISVFLATIYKPFPKSVTVFDDNILKHAWLSEQFDELNFLGPS